jgi:ribose transport system ATP-binding protein
MIAGLGYSRGTTLDAAAIVLEDVSFSLRKGEILGMAGLVGAGRSEIAQAIFGIDPASSGEVRIAGRAVDIHSPSDAMAHGLGLVAEGNDHAAFGAGDDGTPFEGGVQGLFDAGKKTVGIEVENGLGE